MNAKTKKALAQLALESLTTLDPGKARSALANLADIGEPDPIKDPKKSKKRHKEFWARMESRGIVQNAFDRAFAKLRANRGNP